MSAGRKLSTEQETAIIAWYANYQRALNDLRKLGSIREKAQENGISTMSLHRIAKREMYEAQRKCKAAGVEFTPLRVKRV